MSAMNSADHAHIAVPAHLTPTQKASVLLEAMPWLRACCVCSYPVRADPSQNGPPILQILQVLLMFLPQQPGICTFGSKHYRNRD